MTKQHTPQTEATQQDDHHAALLAARYGSQEKPDSIIWNPQIEHLLEHKSVRSFLDKPLAEGALETMVAAAQSASNSSNLNQWSLIAVSDPETRKQLAYLARPYSVNDNGEENLEPIGVNHWIAEAPMVLLWVVDGSRNYNTAINHGSTPVVFDYLDSMLMGAVDTALAAQNAALAAQSLGLGLTYLGSIRNRAKEVAELVELPQHGFVVFGMAIGYPDPAHDTNIRPRPAQNVLHHESYHHAPDGWLDAYEDAFDNFRTTSHIEDLGELHRQQHRLRLPRRPATPPPNLPGARLRPGLGHTPAHRQHP